MVEKELPAVRDALELLGYPSGSVKIAIVICQKGHHTRLVFEERMSDGTARHLIRVLAGAPYLAVLTVSIIDFQDPPSSSTLVLDL